MYRRLTSRARFACRVDPITRYSAGQLFHAEAYMISLQINGRDVLAQERIAGVGLNIAWQISRLLKKSSFKQQARDVLRRLSHIKPHSATKRSYIVPDEDPVEHRGIQELGKDIILFSQSNKDSDLNFMP